MSDAPARRLDAADADDDDLPRCKCGTDRDSRFSFARREYGFFGTLYLLWGGTAIPTKVEWQCVKCGETFDSTTSPSLCREYIK